MAKELPYFKFEPSEWLEGEIQICSDKTIVCFINLCSGYWLKLGCISYAFALQKYCLRDENVLKELIENNIIHIDGENIIINFLDKQLNEFQKTSEARRKSANKRWSDANALQNLSKSNAIREDKIKENKIIEDNRNLKKEKTEKVFSEEIKSIYEKSLSFFSENLHPKNPNDWMKCIDELIRIDKIPPEIILEATQRARADSFWSEQFMALTKLRRKSPDGIPYIVVFYEKFLKPKPNEINKRNNSKGVTDDELARTLHDHFTKQREQNGSN